MSSRPANPKTHLEIPPITSGENGHLPALKRLAPLLEAAAGKTLPPPPSGLGYYSPALLALLNLAARGIRPATLGRGGRHLLALLVQEFFPGPSDNGPEGDRPREIVDDESNFAAQTCQIFEVFRGLDVGDCLPLVTALKELLTEAGRRQTREGSNSGSLAAAIAADCLAAGWAHEYLTDERVLRAGQDRAGANSAPAAILASTQFFTPSWIAAYLCSEAINEKQTFTLLDPACGAGHILVQALRSACSDRAEIPTKMRAEPAGKEETLRNLLAHSIFGIDVDAVLLRLAAFAIYLTSYDILGYCRTNLPAPNLYCLEAPIGSLALGRGRLSMRNINGLVLQDSPLPEFFDAVVMNPPYLSTRTMDDTTADYLKEHFPSSSGDLYTAFIQLSMSLLKGGGRLATIVQQSFLSITRYRNFRLQLIRDSHLISCVQLGTGAFPSRPGEKVNNAVIVLQKKDASNFSGEETPIKYLRLHGKADHCRVMEQGLAQFPHQSINRRQALAVINKLSGQPFALHCPEEIAGIFGKAPSLADQPDHFVLTNGLFTCDNRRFVKLAADIASEELPDYVPYDKGGGHKWYHRTPYMLHWGADGQAIRDFRAQRGQSRRLPGEDYYRQAGITYSYIGTKGFCARLLSPDSIFDIASSAVFSRHYDLHYLLGFLNSALVAYLLSILNPTVNFQIGDLRRLPFENPEPMLEKEVAGLAAEAVVIVQALSTDAEDGIGKGFALPSTFAAGQAKRNAAMIERESQIQKTIDELIFDHYKVSAGARAAVLDDPWVKRSRRPIK